MSLNWDVTAVQDWKAIVEADELVITDALATTTIPVNIGQLTKRNWQDFFERLDIIQREDGAMFKCGGQNFYFTQDQVQRRIGLKTNMETVSRRTWDRQRRRRIIDRALSAAKHRREQGYQTNRTYR